MQLPAACVVYALIVLINSFRRVLYAGTSVQSSLRKTSQSGPAYNFDCRPSTICAPPAPKKSPVTFTTMAPQHVEIAETLAAVKRALRRGKEGQQCPRKLHSFRSEHCMLTLSPHPAPIAQPITAASNRGKKLEQGAKYVHEGSLSFTHGPDVYKQVCCTILVPTELRRRELTHIVPENRTCRLYALYTRTKPSQIQRIRRRAGR